MISNTYRVAPYQYFRNQVPFRCFLQNICFDHTLYDHYNKQSNGILQPVDFDLPQMKPLPASTEKNSLLALHYAFVCCCYPHPTLVCVLVLLRLAHLPSKFSELTSPPTELDVSLKLTKEHHHRYEKRRSSWTINAKSKMPTSHFDFLQELLLSQLPASDLVERIMEYHHR